MLAVWAPTNPRCFSSFDQHPINSFSPRWPRCGDKVFFQNMYGSVTISGVNRMPDIQFRVFEFRLAGQHETIRPLAARQVSTGLPAAM